MQPRQQFGRLGCAADGDISTGNDAARDAAADVTYCYTTG